MASPKLKFVTVTSKSYGAPLKGTRIFYEGAKPKGLKPDGRIVCGKNTLELLRLQFGPKFHWILTRDTDEIRQERGIYRVRTSLRLLNRMQKELFDRTRDIKNDIVRRLFATTFPTEFPVCLAPPYSSGTLATILRPGTAQKLSAEDKEAIEKFLPEFIAAESIKSVNLLKAAAQIKTLKELAEELQKALGVTHGESWWQTFIRDKILIIQQGYIKAIEKMNVSLGVTKFPDFCLVTHDNYLDILEIKKPDTNLLKLDSGRGNYYVDSELSRAIIQIENYIEQIVNQADRVRSYIKDNHQLDMKVVRPRGIILAGDARSFDQKQKDDLRLLSQGLKNLTVVTYDELLVRLRNYISVLESATRAE